MLPNLSAQPCPNITHKLRMCVQCRLDTMAQTPEKAGVRPRGGVVTQRIANPRTPVQFRTWPPLPDIIG